MIAYVYLACLLILWLLRVAIRAISDFVGWSNAFGLRNAIARERGIVAYRAWVPFERIRPADIPQDEWEEAYAWPANNKPPYPPLAHRVLRELISYVAVVVVAAVLLQLFTPFSVLTWLWSSIRFWIALGALTAASASSVPLRGASSSSLYSRLEMNLMALPSDGIAATLDEIAERIRAAKDYYEREAAIAAFRAACRGNVKPLDPALEAVNRNITLINPRSDWA